MAQMDGEAAAKFINALIKSVQTLCHGYLDFSDGIEIIGNINLSVDKGSYLHYIVQEKVCKNEENITLFISNSFHAQNQKDLDAKGKDSQNVQSGSQIVQRTNSTDTGETGKVSSAISSISSALSSSHEKSRSGSTSSAKESNSVHSKPASSTAKRKASDDHNSDVRSAKSVHTSSSPSPVSHFLSRSPHNPSGSSSPVDTKPSLRELRGESTVLPQTADVSGDGVGDIGVNLASSVLERVDDQSTSDLPDRGDDSDGDLEVTFIKEEFVEGEQSACQFDNSSGQQYSRGTHHRASSDSMPDASLYPVSLHHSASATYVPSAHDISAAQHFGPSTSSSQTGVRGTRGQQGAPRQLRHTGDLGFRVGEAAFSPPLAHHAHPTIAHHVPELPVLDLSIKTEPRDPDFFVFNCHQRRKKNSLHSHSREEPPVEEARQKAKEKSKQYRQKQKIQRMTDATYDMVFRHQVAERKRRQRMREKINKLKLYSGGFSIAK